MSEEVKKKRSPIRVILDILYYIVVAVVIIAALGYTVLTFASKDGMTSFFGYYASAVQTGSMSGTFEVGDVIITKEVEPEDVAVGDVIMFNYIEPQTNEAIIVTHRVNELGDGYVITQGDVAKSQNSVDKVEKVLHGDIISEYSGTKIPGLGKVSDFLKTEVGFFCCILLPVVLFLFWQLFVFIKTLIDAKSITKEKEINDEARKMAEQMLLEMQKEKQASEAAAPAESVGESETDAESTENTEL